MRMLSPTEGRRQLLGALVLGYSVNLAGLRDGWELVAKQLIAEGRAKQQGEALALVPPEPGGWLCERDVPDVLTAARQLLEALAGAPLITDSERLRRARSVGLGRDPADRAWEWLTEADVVAVGYDADGRQATCMAVDPPAHARPAPPPVPPSAPIPAARPTPTPVAKPAPPAPPRPAAVTKPVSPPATDPEPELLALQRRATFAAEVSAGLVAAPQRVRTPLGLSPLLDTQLRLCVVFAAAARPLTVHDLTQSWLSKSQIEFLKPALADGVRRGGFTVAGAVGRYGSRYTLADPTAFDATWESVNSHAAGLRARRDARRV